MNPSKILENLDCENKEKCQIEFSEEYSTLAYYIPIYNGFGENKNSDANHTSGQFFCRVCGHIWRYTGSDQIAYELEKLQ